MNHAEIAAQAIVEAAIPGSRMVYQEDQSRSVPDFNLHYPNGQIAALEVTASVDSAAVEMYAVPAPAAAT